MPRNLDTTALRAFVTVADVGGVTRAAGLLNLTQSAVSMQLKRLEESLDTALLDRSGRGVALTAAGEQLLGYGRQILDLNDEVFARLTATEFKGEIKLGVPHDIIYPTIPPVLKRFAVAFPQVKLRLISAPTRRLLEMFGRGEVDVILTTEEACGPGGETLGTMPLVWIGATGGAIWRQRPLPIAFCNSCIFRTGVLKILSDKGVDWEMAVESDLDNAVEAAVSADLAVNVRLRGTLPPNTEEIAHGGALPALKPQRINLYLQSAQDPVSQGLRDIIRQSYAMAPGLPETVMA